MTSFILKHTKGDVLKNVRNVLFHRMKVHCTEKHAVCSINVPICDKESHKDADFPFLSELSL